MHIFHISEFICSSHEEGEEGLRPSFEFSVSKESVPWRPCTVVHRTEGESTWFILHVKIGLNYLPKKVSKMVQNNSSISPKDSNSTCILYTCTWCKLVRVFWSHGNPLLPVMKPFTLIQVEIHTYISKKGFVKFIWTSYDPHCTKFNIALHVHIIWT